MACTESQPRQPASAQPTCKISENLNNPFQLLTTHNHAHNSLSQSPQSQPCPINVVPYELNISKASHALKISKIASHASTHAKNQHAASQNTCTHNTFPMASPKSQHSNSTRDRFFLPLIQIQTSQFHQLGWAFGQPDPNRTCNLF